MYIYKSNFHIHKIDDLDQDINLFVSSKRGRVMKKTPHENMASTDFRLYRLAWEKQLAALKAEISS